MAIAGFLLRVFSYLLHLLLSLFLTLLGVVALVGGVHNLSLPVLPWEGAKLTWWVLGLGIGGLLITLLAMTGKFRYLFPFWCLFALAMLIRGFFLSSLYYGSASSFEGAVALTVGALIAFVCSLWMFRTRRRTY